MKLALTVVATILLLANTPVVDHVAETGRRASSFGVPTTIQRPAQCRGLPPSTSAPVPGQLCARRLDHDTAALTTSERLTAPFDIQPRGAAAAAARPHGRHT
ncbi:hypothetical protein [Amycolatopsis sp. NPDC051903]|uniref:hypothetical protein n=1 Tax=Amycolatopsis sp. NPDC051903 TaxID=3363936 RepID=UPI003795D642